MGEKEYPPQHPPSYEDHGHQDGAYPPQGQQYPQQMTHAPMYADQPPPQYPYPGPNPQGQPLTQQPYGQQNVIYVAPNPPMSNPPNDWLCFNIFVTICCCWPIGIIAILKSVETREAIGRGNGQRATEGSRQARRWGMITLGVGIVMLVISLVITGVYVYMIFQNIDDYDKK